MVCAKKFNGHDGSLLAPGPSASAISNAEQGAGPGTKDQSAILVFRVPGDGQ
jgi:hypothetical protein